MPADADKVKDAVEAVKKMQELEIGQSQFHSALEHFKERPNYPSTRHEQDNLKYATILAEQYDELIAIYKKIDISAFVKIPEFCFKKIPELAAKHHELLADSSYTNNMDYQEIFNLFENPRSEFFQVLTLIGAMVILDNDYETFKNAALIFSTEKENFNALKDTMMKKHELWETENLKLKKETGELRKEIGELRKEIEEVLELARDASAEAGTFAHAAFFKEQGREHENKQIKWLWASSIMSVVLLGYLIGSYYFSSLPDVWGPTAILQAAIRALAFSLLLSILIFCVKNYKAHGHNHIVNTHRANSLKTYRAIVEGASSPDAQDIILANAAQHIFTPLDTGYVKGADSVGNPTVEIIRNVVKSADKEG